jgi:hypothetical protein
MTTPPGLQTGATEISDRTTGYELKVNQDGSLNADDAALQGPIAVTVTSPLTSGQDNTITFASKVRTVQLHNQSAVNVPYEHDQAATVNSPYLAPGQMIYVDVHTTVIHVFPSNALPVNAANGLIVRGWV